jgi:mannose-6-phosphate isomerase
MNQNDYIGKTLKPWPILVDHYISCTVFKEKPFESLLLEPIPNNGIDEYYVPVSDFKFAVISNSSSKVVHVDSAEVLFAIDDTAVITHSDGDSCVIKKGESVFVPAYAKNYTVSCKGRVARAYC